MGSPPTPHQPRPVPVLDAVLREVPRQLDTPRFTLRPPRTGDGAMLHEAVVESLPALRAFVTSVPWAAHEPSVDASEVYCRRAEADVIARRDLPFLILDRGTGRLLGATGLHRFDWSVPRFEIGYWCRSSATGQGVISEAVRALSDLAESGFDAARMEIRTDALNTRARAVAERCGFLLEGVLRHERRAPDGSLRDTCVYARVRRPA
jgi:RimJ/RimL family protein N-acetyltransferase